MTLTSTAVILPVQLHVLHTKKNLIVKHVGVTTIVGTGVRSSQVNSYYRGYTMSNLRSIAIIASCLAIPCVAQTEVYARDVAKQTIGWTPLAALLPAPAPLDTVAIAALVTNMANQGLLGLDFATMTRYVGRFTGQIDAAQVAAVQAQIAVDALAKQVAAIVATASPTTGGKAGFVWTWGVGGPAWAESPWSIHVPSDVTSRVMLAKLSADGTWIADISDFEAVALWPEAVFAVYRDGLRLFPSEYKLASRLYSFTDTQSPTVPNHVVITPALPWPNTSVVYVTWLELHTAH